MSAQKQTSLADFQVRLGAYKEIIDEDIARYCKHINDLTLKTYGENSQIITNAYADLLIRGGKRIRGVLTLVGYEMCGGKDKDMIIQAARAIEMMHAYILIIDDIQDRSNLRRGGPTVHKLLEKEQKKQKWSGDSEHTGVALALNAAILGMHNAEIVLANLDVEVELRIKAINIMNHTMMVTAHGQTNDIINEISPGITSEDVDKVMQWKTAHYTFLNPIHMGMVLAGAPCEDTNAITEYALNVGKAFQITDDLLIVSTDEDSGKQAMNDICEGKQTLLTVHALNNANKSDANFLRKCLGSQNLTDADFKRCKDILISSGTVDNALNVATGYVETAKKSLHQHAQRWTPETVEFLDDLAQYLLIRSH